MILTAQSIDVDSVSSATVTSNAIKAAVADCIAQAGGDAQALKSVAEKEPVQDAVYDVDVVVVGAGAAGLSAANTALEAGANVLILEKTGVTGGSTARSGGKILGAGTEWPVSYTHLDVYKRQQWKNRAAFSMYSVSSICLVGERLFSGSSSRYSASSSMAFVNILNAFSPLEYVRTFMPSSSRT